MGNEKSAGQSHSLVISRNTLLNVMQDIMGQQNKPLGRLTFFMCDFGLIE